MSLELVTLLGTSHATLLCVVLWHCLWHILLCLRIHLPGLLQVASRVNRSRCIPHATLGLWIHHKSC
jgi:hypothetical protein